MSNLHVAADRASPEFLQWLAAGCLGWLGVGTFALALTPMPAYTAQSGWSPVFWLVVAPLCALAGLVLRGPAGGRAAAALKPVTGPGRTEQCRATGRSCAKRIG